MEELAHRLGKAVYHQLRRLIGTRQLRWRHGIHSNNGSAHSGGEMHRPRVGREQGKGS